ncbi:MAG: hypothetical protein ABH831_02805 [Candidatus Nealsonbacteria bacterium]
MPSVSTNTKTLVDSYLTWHQSQEQKQAAGTIHVDEVALKVASFYEKIRGVVDWKEEHLFRKGAIERILKRRLLFKKNGEKIATPLVYELIRGGHFPNDKIKETKIEEVQLALSKYSYILEHAPIPQKKKLAEQFNDWMSGIAACEIEDILSNPIRENALLDYMTKIMEERIRIREGILKVGGISEEEKNTQIYIASQRALLNPDASLITYNLLKRKFPSWKNISKEEVDDVAKNIYSIREEIENNLNHRLADKFYRVCEKYDTPFLIIGDILAGDSKRSREIVSNPEELEIKTKQTYEKRAKTLKSRLGRAAFYATLSIFLTNILSLYAIEFPLAKFVLGNFTPLAIAIDVFVPTLLMFFLIVSIPPPPKENSDITIMEVMKIVYEEKSSDIYEVKSNPKRNLITRILISIFYIFGFSIVAGLIVWGLEIIHLPITSHVIFIIFISLITFAGTKIRRRAKELEIVETKENFLFFFVDLFAIPMAQLGKWLSSKWKRYNAIAKFFSYLIDMPFQLLVEFLEHWRYFLKEKREELH